MNYITEFERSAITINTLVDFGANNTLRVTIVFTIRWFCKHHMFLFMILFCSPTTTRSSEEDFRFQISWNLGQKIFFMVISLLKLLQIYCTKHIIVVLVKPRTSFLHTKVLSYNKCWRVSKILTFILITLWEEIY